MSTITEALLAKGHTVTGEVCEKCWNDAYMESLATGRSQADCYAEITVKAETEADHGLTCPCRVCQLEAEAEDATWD